VFKRNLFQGNSFLSKKICHLRKLRAIDGKFCLLFGISTYILLIVINNILIIYNRGKLTDKIIDLERWLAIKNCEKVYKDKRFIKYIAREREGEGENKWSYKRRQRGQLKLRTSRKRWNSLTSQPMTFYPFNVKASMLCFLSHFSSPAFSFSPSYLSTDVLSKW